MSSDKGGQGAIIMTPTPFVLYSIISAFEIYSVLIRLDLCLKGGGGVGGAETAKRALMLYVMQISRTGFTVNKRKPP